MADYRAIMGITEAVMGLLRTSYRPDDFNNELEFKVFNSKDFSSNSIANGAAFFYTEYTAMALIEFQQDVLVMMENFFKANYHWNYTYW